MTKRLVFVNIIIALAFAVAPHLDLVERHITFAEPATAFSWLITIGSLLYALSSSALIWISDQGARAVTAARDDLKSYVQAPTIRPLRDDEFYAMFLETAKSADSHVYISYLGPTNPGQTRHRERDAYYTAILNAIRGNRRAAFRRLMRNTESNRTWCAQRIKQWEDLPNMSVALLPDYSGGHDMPLPLSVQTVDTQHAWLVAVEGHERSGPHRDLYINDSTSADFLEKYFRRLWSRATTIIDHGQPVNEGRQMLVGKESQP